jgi:hypothetical protein
MDPIQESPGLINYQAYGLLNQAYNSNNHPDCRIKAADSAITLYERLENHPNNTSDRQFQAARAVAFLQELKVQINRCKQSRFFAEPSNRSVRETLTERIIKDGIADVGR